MGVPTILYDSATGSDTLASGAGPGTAITGSKARTRSAAGQLHVGFFEASAPDLSGIATDGTHVLWANAATSRRFSSIAAKKDTQQTDTGNITSGAAVLSALSSTTGWTAGDVIKVAGAGAAGADLYSTILTVDSGTQVTLNDNAGTTVTGGAVTNPKQVTLTTGEDMNLQAADRTWAIGGKRATLSGGTAICADNKPGWILDFASGHSESFSASNTFTGTGDETTGWITIRGNGTRPIFKITGSAGICLRMDGTKYVIRHVRLQGSNTFCRGISFDPGSAGGPHYLRVEDCELDGNGGGGTALESGVEIHNNATSPNVVVRDCYFHNCSTAGINRTNSGGQDSGPTRIENCYFKANAIGILNGNGQGFHIHDCIFDSQTSHGIHMNQGSLCNTFEIKTCTFYANGGDGIRCTGTSAAANSSILACNFASNTGYGINFNSADITNIPMAYTFDYNNFDANNGGAGNAQRNNVPAGSHDTALGSSFANASGGNFAVGTNLKATGYPDATRTIGGAASSTLSYVDIGAAQRQEAGGLMRHPGMAAQFNA